MIVLNILENNAIFLKQKVSSQHDGEYTMFLGSFL